MRQLRTSGNLPDLRGFTAFAERIGPEDVVGILNDHFDLQVAIIAKHGGFVVDFLGDSVFAVFGAPGADPQHAERLPMRL